MTPLEANNMMAEMVYGPWWVRTIRFFVVTIVLTFILWLLGAPLWAGAIAGIHFGSKSY